MLSWGQDREQLKVVGRVGAIGIEMGLAVVVGYYGGRWLDEAFGTAPVLTWVGLAFGLAAGFKSLYQLTRRTQRELERDESEDARFSRQDPR